MIVPAHILITDFFNALQPSGSPLVEIHWIGEAFWLSAQRGDRYATLRMSTCVVELVDRTRPNVAPVKLSLGVLGAKTVAQQVRTYLT